MQLTRRAERGMGRARRWLTGLVALAIVGLGGAEAGARLLGAIDIPLYGRDPQIGYFLQPGQSGRFLNRHGWHLDADGAVPGPTRPGRAVLVIGDSVVAGPNAFDQSERLGPVLGEELGVPVRSGAAGGWGLLNEIAWLNAHREVLAASDTLVFVTNSGDFDQMALWTSETLHPTHRPLSALAYLFERTVVNRGEDVVIDPTGRRDWRAELRTLLAGYRGRVLFCLYPKRDELAEHGRDRPTDLDRRAADLAATGQRTAFVWASPGWRDGSYRDDIHPSVAGTRALAGIVAASVRSSFPDAFPPPASR